MPRKAAIVPNRHLHTTLPALLAGRVELILHSSLEGKTPQGAWQELITMLLREYLDHRSLDLAPFLDTLPGVHVVRAPAHTLSALEAFLTRRSE